MEYMRLSHDQLPVHICHEHRCEGCGDMIPHCESVLHPVIGSLAVVIMCEDVLGCGLRIHLRVHGKASRNLGCVYCMSGTNCPPELPLPEFTMEWFAQKYGPAWEEPVNGSG